MNPIEKDIKFFYDVDDETDSLEHYGTKRHSGRYPWGSGENPYQRSGDFLSRVEELKKTGKFTEKEILEQINATLPDEYKMGTTEFRVAQQKALHERKALQYDQIRALKDDGLKWTEIGEKLGLSESTVRSMYNNGIGEKANQAQKIAETLKAEVDKKGMIDVSEGTNLVLGVSEGNSMTLKASSFPGQSTKVILPLTKISEKECYCPTYENGTQLALIRYPHAGTFEIPIVTVNNKNVSGKRNFGNIQDAIGINSKVAERLSGADFDGDTVVAIPISSKVAVKATAALRDLKDFDPKTAYAVPEGNPNGVRLMKKEEKQKEMGIISNLITDMTLRGADEKEIARAVKHSMVVIDAEKHKLDYKRSERENGIQELKKKWQIRVDEDGNEHFGGASTLLSRRKQTVYVPERKGSVRIDKETGELIYKESGRRYFDKEKGEFVDAQQKVSLISMTPDARTLSSGTPQENLYADFSNELKALARQARKEAANMKGLVYSPAAAKEYRAEVDSINAKLESVIANKPKERRAMVIANANIKAKIQALDLDPKLDKKEIKKISSVEMQRARDSIGASGSKTRITFTDREWEAVQKGAISDSKLTKILNASKSDEIVKRAMPKTATVITNAKMAKAKAMLANGYTYNEIAKACGVPESTVYSALNK